ncbi:hypothetical protein A5819_000052 [Enterococcus sp. 7E2_DIV0204]|uniref:hypothetical protein n=1 Tax=unclassified Enterococcus TaxID=2608891 RepID=UPI000A32C768|nr:MULTISPECIES: hypothetical protein [unclassified Enterococcus]OTN87606.1 hypothetical protein A5819_000052 [Enterococcus sp. 7E2_DIV0204]OTP49712.1 hypothetical protein A5884_002912 [Enterococcus sp. 7D2_DIV0200]
MKRKHKLGDYLYKNGNIYKLVPHWENNFISEFYSIFSEESTGKIFCSPYLIKDDDPSYSAAMADQIEKFDLTQKLYQ